MSAFKDWLNGLTSKTTPVDADELYVRDSSGTPGSKKLTWANLKATLANTFLSLTGGTVAGGERTTSGSTLTITETLNNAGVTFPGALVVDVTDAASAAGSLLVDLKVGGVSKLAVKKQYGVIQLSDANGAVDFYSTPGNIGAQYSLYGARLRSSSSIEWSSSSSYINAPNDIVLLRDAAGVLAQRNGTNAQTFRIYNTYTDASNYERGFMRWVSNVLEIGSEAAGTGIVRRTALTLYKTNAGTTNDKLTINGVDGSGSISVESNGLGQHYQLIGDTTGAGGPAELRFGAGALITWRTTNRSDAGSQSLQLGKAADGVFGLAGGTSADGAAAQLLEMTAPSAPATNGVRIYAEDNGSGKTRLMALFATGSAVQIAIEP